MANQFNLSSASFVTGAPESVDAGWVVMAMDELAASEIEHSAILRFRGGIFEAVSLKMFRTRTALGLPGRSEIIFVGDNGQCVAIDAAGIERDEFVTSSQRNPRNTGHIRAATRIGDEVVVVGMQRQVYLRDGSGAWSDFMAGLPAADSEVTGFECVLAVSRDEIYAAGWRGEIWMFDGRSWRPIDSPTNRVVTGMCVDPSGSVAACGQGGLLLRGRRNSWEVVHEGECPVDLWSIDGSTGSVFTAGLRFIFDVRDSGAEMLDLGAESYGELVSDAGALWSFGQKDFLAFDGSNWRRVA